MSDGCQVDGCDCICWEYDHDDDEFGLGVCTCGHLDDEHGA